MEALRAAVMVKLHHFRQLRQDLPLNKANLLCLRSSTGSHSPQTDRRNQ